MLSNIIYTLSELQSCSTEYLVLHVSYHCIMQSVDQNYKANYKIISYYKKGFTASELSGFTCTSSLTTAKCGIENFEFIVSEQVQVNPNNSRAMSALTFLLFKLNTLQAKIVKLLSQPKPWCNDGVLNLHHGQNTTIMTSKRLFHHNPVSSGTNQPIRKSEFIQCMKVE